MEGFLGTLGDSFEKVRREKYKFAYGKCEMTSGHAELTRFGASGRFLKKDPNQMIRNRLL